MATTVSLLYGHSPLQSVSYGRNKGAVRPLDHKGKEIIRLKGRIKQLLGRMAHPRQEGEGGLLLSEASPLRAPYHTILSG